MHKKLKGAVIKSINLTGDTEKNVSYPKVLKRTEKALLNIWLKQVQSTEMDVMSKQREKDINSETLKVKP